MGRYCVELGATARPCLTKILMPPTFSSLCHLCCYNCLSYLCHHCCCLVLFVSTVSMSVLLYVVEVLMLNRGVFYLHYTAKLLFITHSGMHSIVIKAVCAIQLLATCPVCSSYLHDTVRMWGPASQPGVVLNFPRIEPIYALICDQTGTHERGQRNVQLLCPFCKFVLSSNFQPGMFLKTWKSEPGCS